MGKDLTQFRPGDEWTGNRNGRPKGSLSLTTLLRRALQSKRICGEPTPDDRPVAEWLVEAMIRQAIRGNPGYMKEIMDRIDGKVVDPVKDEISLADLVAAAEERATKRREERDGSE